MKNRECRDKVRHLSFKAAQEEAGRLSNRFKEVFNAYECTYCNYFHTGHNRTLGRSIIAIYVDPKYNNSLQVKDYIRRLANNNFIVTSKQGWDKNIREFCSRYGILYLNKVDEINQCTVFSRRPLPEDMKQLKPKVFQ
jgi:hypothetical protein